MKIRDKMSSPAEVGPIVEKVVERLKRVSRKLAPAKLIGNANEMLLQVARNPEAKRDDLLVVFDQLKSFSYLAQLQILQVKPNAFISDDD